MQKMWKKALRNPVLDTMSPTEISTKVCVCSIHFTKENHNLRQVREPLTLHACELPTAILNFVQKRVQVKENVKTPHRIKLCDPPATMSPSTISPASMQAKLTIKPSRKYRTRRKLVMASSIISPNKMKDARAHITSKLKQTPSNGMKPLPENEPVITANTKPLVALQNSNLNTNIQNGHILEKLQNFNKQHRLSDSHKMTDFFGVDRSLNVSENKPVEERTNKVNISNNKACANHKLTEYYPVRRSVRKTSRSVLAEKMWLLEKAIKEQREDGLKITTFEGKGRGVIATQVFKRGEFVVEYAGELLGSLEAREREQNYAHDDGKGCYMYYFRYGGQQYCIDATAESGKLGRLVNHSRSGNLMTKALLVEGVPHLVLLAAHDIRAGEELTYDYGDRSKESLRHHPWLAL